MSETDLEHQSERRAYWRARAENAEAEVERLREALARIADTDGDPLLGIGSEAEFAAEVLAARDGDAT